MSATGVFGPAPPGIDLSKTQNGSIVRAVVSLMVIGTLAVILRLASRVMSKKRKLAIDDYLIVVGLLFAHGTAICCIASLPYGGGKHLWVLTAKQFTTIWQILFAYVMIYATAVSFTKASIVMFYWRLFNLRWAVYICLFLVWSYWFVIIVTINTGCQPLEFFWTQYTTPGAHGHCIDVPLFFFANGIWAMLVDVCILVTPIPIIYKLQMPRRQKVLVGGILLLGGFVCVASIVRIITIHHLIHSVDLTWAMAGVFIWSCCEPFIGIVCACIPTYAPLLRHFWHQARSSAGGSSSKPGRPGRKNTADVEAQASNSSIPGANRVERSARDPFRISKGKREWNRITHPNQSDDELQLTSDISGPGKGAERGRAAYPLNDIVVKKDFTWNSTHMVDPEASD